MIEVREVKEEHDNVNHPSHYTECCSLECIDVMTIVFGKTVVIWFCLCNAFKYLWRHKYKNGSEDIRKARWYVNKAFELGFKKKRQCIIASSMDSFLNDKGC